MLLEQILSQYNKRYSFKILAFFFLSSSTFQYYIQFQNLLVSTNAPNFTCQYDSTISGFKIASDQCSVNVNGSTIKCTKWIYSPNPVGKTMISDYDLVCDRKYLVDLVLVIWYGTSLIGPITGWLSDRFGRKKVALFCLCLETVTLPLVGFASDIITNIIILIFVGSSRQGCLICYIWLMESVDEEFREFVGSFFWLFGCLAYVCCPLIVFLTMDWRQTQLVSLLPNILYLGILFIPESPRWSCAMNRVHELSETLKKIAKVNKVQIEFSYFEIDVEKLTETEKCRNVLKDIVFAKRTIITSVFFFATALLSVSVSLDLTILSNNIFISMFFIGLMETPGTVLSYFTLRYFKRKHSLLMTGVIGATLIFIAVLFSRNNTWLVVLRIIVGCIAKLCITSFETNAFLYAMELFATTHRSLVLGILQFGNCFAFILAIYIKKLASVYYILPMLFCVIMFWIALVLMYFTLPETKDLPVPETISDQNMFIIDREQEYLDYMNNQANKIHLDCDDSTSDTNCESSGLIKEK